MTHQTGKMSEMMKEMAERLLRHPDDTHSSEAAHVSLMFANIAWNETVGLAHAPDDLRRILTCGIPDGKIRVV